ncbi:MAG: LysR family transcriptional regulator, partial [Pseudomonadota bacterium]
MDRFSTMKAFIAVADYGSFVAAGDALGISRPMVSKHVQRLEDELGIILLNRTTRRVSLTEAGRQFRDRCRVIFEYIDDAFHEAGNQRSEPKGELRINAPLSFGRVHLTRAIVEFQRAYPDVSIDLTLNDRQVDIIDEGYDLA